MRLFALAFLFIGFSETKTQKCPPGQVPDHQGICIEPRYMQGCYQYASSLQCNKCQYKYKLNSSGLCQYQKQSFEPCCLQKQGNQCKTCNTGLLLNSDGTCIQNVILGCLEKNLIGNCVNCASDYMIWEGRCKPGVKDCSTYLQESDGKICVKCKNNFSLVNNACLKNKILGCELQRDHKCQKCLNPFKPKGDHCQIQNCSTYNDFGCTACECGYFLNARNVCQEIQPGCIRYERGICNDCQPHFRLRGGLCVIQGCEQLDFLTCQKCSEDYTLANGGCKLKNCTNWDHGVCYACDMGFVTKQGKCVAQSKSLIREN